MEADRRIPRWFAAPLAWGRLGISGARVGPTDAQRETAAALLRALASPRALLTCIAHGDCMGVDAEVHCLALELGLYVDVHPPALDGVRAWCDGARVTIHPPRPYLERNECIVEASSALLAVPRDQSRGTWHAVRCADRRGIPVAIVAEDGAVQWRCRDLALRGARRARHDEHRPERRLLR